MLDLTMGNSLWHLIKQSDFIAKMVLVILLAMSILCWTVFFCKIIIYRLRKRDLQRLHDQLSAVRSWEDIVIIASAASNTIPGRFLARIVMVITTFNDSNGRNGRSLDSETLYYHIDQITDTFLFQEESYVPILLTSAGVAPLLGLFGTVWGLVHSFVRISEKQSADIVVVAPGIAEALMTTLVGLVVAIPAFVMYHYMQYKLRQIEQEAVSLADKVRFIMEQSL